MNEIIRGYACATCDSKKFRDKTAYEKHCGTHRHRFRAQGLSLEDAKQKVKEASAIKISEGNKRWALTHENTRKGILLTEEQKASCREVALRRIHGDRVPYLPETHPDVAKEWHPTKNGGKAPSNYTSGSDAKVHWLCPVKCPEGCAHEYEQTIGNRSNGHGCPYCSRLRLCVHGSIRFTHPLIASEWHPSKNGDLLPDTIPYGSKTPVWWLCPIRCPDGCAHEYLAAPLNRCGVNRQNCPFCCNQQICVHSSIQHTHPEVAKEWHPTKNGDKAPSSFSSGSSAEKIWWKCDQGHEWQAILNNRCRGSGCPHCRPKYSRQQLEWLRYRSVSRPGIQYAEHGGEYRIPGTGYIADGFHADTNTVYEYQGDFWHGNPLVFCPSDVNPTTGTTYGFLFERTQTKIEDIKGRGYKVIEVWEMEWQAGKRAVVALQRLWVSFRAKRGLLR